MSPDFEQPVHIVGSDILAVDIYFGWEQRTVGFGRLTIRLENDGTYYVDSECMGREWGRRALHAFVDALVDDIPEEKFHG